MRISTSTKNITRALLRCLVGMSGCCVLILMVMLHAQSCPWALIPLAFEVRCFIGLLVAHVCVCAVGTYSLTRRSFLGVFHFYRLSYMLLILNICLLPSLIHILLNAEDSTTHQINETTQQMIVQYNKTEVCAFWMNMQETMVCNAPSVICDMCRFGAREFCSPHRIGCTTSLVRFLNAHLLCIVLLYTIRIFVDAMVLCNESKVLKEMRDKKKRLQKKRLVHSQKFDKTEESQKPDKPEESEESVDSKPKEIRFFQRALDSLMSNYPTVVQTETNDDRIRYL